MFIHTKGSTFMIGLAPKFYWLSETFVADMKTIHALDFTGSGVFILAMHYFPLLTVCR